MTGLQKRDPKEVRRHSQFSMRRFLETQEVVPKLKNRLVINFKRKAVRNVQMSNRFVKTKRVSKSLFKPRFQKDGGVFLDDYRPFSSKNTKACFVQTGYGINPQFRRQAYTNS